MVVPNNFHYFQGVVIAEVSCTLVVYIILQTVYYLKWGYEEEPKVKAEDGEPSRINKWDQSLWNSYFPIIFANHLIALALPILYSPEAYIVVFSFIHFGLFMILVIVNICAQEERRTVISRVLWGLMCLDNVFLIIAGLAGSGNILKQA